MVRILQCILLSSCLGLLSSCISFDNDVDYSGEISMDIELASGGLSFPVGELGKARLDSLIHVSPDGSSLIRVSENGDYYIYKDGVLDAVTVDVEPLQINVEDPEIGLVQLHFADPGLLAGAFAESVSAVATSGFEADIEDETSISFNEKVDDAVVSVNSLLFAYRSPVAMDFSFSGFPESIERLTVRNYSFVFPSFFRLVSDGSDPRVETFGNVMTFNGTVTREELAQNDWTISIRSLYLTGLFFEEPLNTVYEGSERRLVVNDKVLHSGTVAVEGTLSSVAELEGTTLQPAVHFERIDVRSFEGLVSPDIDAVTADFPLNLDDDLDFLKAEDNTFRIRNLGFNVDLISGFSAPLNLNMSMNSWDESGRPVAESVSPDYGMFQIPAAPHGGKMDARIVITDEPGHSGSTADGHIVQVYVSRLSDLVRTIPDRISVSIDAETDVSEDVLHYVEFGSTISVTGDYEVYAPLCFSSASVNYTKVLEDVGDELDDFADKLTDAKIQACGRVVNTVPFDLEVTVVPLDKNGSEIDGDIRFSKAAVKAGSLNSPAITDVVIDAEAHNGRLADLDALKIVVHCADDDGHEAVLNRNEYLEFTNFILNVRDGIILDLDD